MQRPGAWMMCLRLSILSRFYFIFWGGQPSPEEHRPFNPIKVLFYLLKFCPFLFSWLTFNPIKVLFYLSSRYAPDVLLTSFNPIKVLFYRKKTHKNKTTNHLSILSRFYFINIFFEVWKLYSILSILSRFYFIYTEIFLHSQPTPFQSYQGSILSAQFCFHSTFYFPLSILSRFYFINGKTRRIGRS